MKKWRQAISDESGNGIPLAVAAALAVLFLFCGISEYARLNLIAAGVRDAVQEAVLSTVNDNYDDVYHGVREGYAGGYYPSGGDWDESLDYGDVYGFLDNLLGMEDYGDYHVKHVDGGRTEEYRISDLDVAIRNAPLRANNSEHVLAETTLILEVPVRFGGSHLPDMQIRMKVQAAYTPVF